MADHVCEYTRLNFCKTCRRVNPSKMKPMSEMALLPTIPPHVCEYRALSGRCKRCGQSKSTLSQEIVPLPVRQPPRQHVQEEVVLSSDHVCEYRPLSGRCKRCDRQRPSPALSQEIIPLPVNRPLRQSIVDTAPLPVRQPVRQHVQEDDHVCEYRPLSGRCKRCDRRRPEPTRTLPSPSSNTGEQFLSALDNRQEKRMKTIPPPRQLPPPSSINPIRRDKEEVQMPAFERLQLREKSPLPFFYDERRSSPVHPNNRQNMHSKRPFACYAISTMQLLKGTIGIRRMVRQMSNELPALQKFLPLGMTEPFGVLHQFMTTQHEDADTLIRLFSNPGNQFLTDVNLTTGCGIEAATLRRLTGASQEDTCEYLNIILQFFSKALTIMGLPLPYSVRESKVETYNCRCGNRKERDETHMITPAVQMEPFDQSQYNLGDLFARMGRTMGGPAICMRCFNEDRKRSNLPEVTTEQMDNITGFSVASRLETPGWHQMNNRGVNEATPGYESRGIEHDFAFGPVAIFPLARFLPMGNGQYEKNRKRVAIPLEILLPTTLDRNHAKAVYRLKAMTIHTGGASISGGHFQCVIADDDNPDKFWLFNNAHYPNPPLEYTFEQLINDRNTRIEENANLFVYEQVESMM